MKFTSVSAVLCAISGACAHPQDPSNTSPVHSITARNAQPILDVLSKASTCIGSLSSAVKNWECSPGPVLKASYSLIDTLKSGATSVSGTATLTLPESLLLLKPVQDIKTHAQDLVDSLKARKYKIQADYECVIVRQIAESMGTCGRAMVEATVSKVPTSVQMIAKVQADMILKVLKDAKASFSETNCVNG
ncbi:hypothetical protein E4U55_001376 [Claviceps digitariae]|nr:hypothetical protein E4U55_001376 [Claviceps digitariae]